MDIQHGLSKVFKNKLIKAFKEDKRRVITKHIAIEMIKDVWIDFLEESLPRK